MTRFANRGMIASAVSTFAVAAALVAGPMALAHAADATTPPAAAPITGVKSGTQVGTSDTAPAASAKSTPGTAATVQTDSVDKTTKPPAAAATTKGTAAPSVAEVPKGPGTTKPADAHKAAKDPAKDKESKAPAIKTDEKTSSTKL